MMPDQLKNWRKKYNYTQARLAAALQVIPLTVSRWELGVRKIPSFLQLTLKSLEKIDLDPGKKKKKRGTHA